MRVISHDPMKNALEECCLQNEQELGSREALTDDDEEDVTWWLY